jgi:hypothetical protein
MFAQNLLMSSTASLLSATFSTLSAALEPNTLGIEPAIDNFVTNPQHRLDRVQFNDPFGHGGKSSVLMSIEPLSDRLSYTGLDGIHEVHLVDEVNTATRWLDKAEVRALTKEALNPERTKGHIFLLPLGSTEDQANRLAELMMESALVQGGRPEIFNLRLSPPYMANPLNVFFEFITDAGSIHRVPTPDIPDLFIISHAQHMPLWLERHAQVPADVDLDESTYFKLMARRELVKKQDHDKEDPRFERYENWRNAKTNLLAYSEDIIPLTAAQQRPSFIFLGGGTGTQREQFEALMKNLPVQQKES